jgi:hypothetical protein
LGIALLAPVAVSSIGCGNLTADSLTSLLIEAADNKRDHSGENGVCGPIELAPLIPDCPLDLVCFTSACEAHNKCYGTCGASRAVCDMQFFQDMTTICETTYAVGDANLTLCRSSAFAYWLAVTTLGQEPFDASQATGCGTADGFPFAQGACCTTSDGCDDTGGQEDCVAAGGAFVPLAFCDELECALPANDDCADSEVVCEDQPDPTDRGWCEDDPDNECSVAQQDCPDGSACIADPLNGYRCTVETDNRLAATDGPEAGAACLESGQDSFQADIWYRYVAPCSGRLTVRMCGWADYDAMLAVYGSNRPGDSCGCPTDNSDLLECDDDFCGGGSASAVVIDGAVEGACYTIRVGGWSWDGTESGTRQGTSELDIRMRCE